MEYENQTESQAFECKNRQIETFSLSCDSGSMPEKDFRFSRTVFCESSDGEPVNSDLRDPFSNIKIEIINVPPPSSKRQLDDSFLEESFKTPLKKHFILSPFFSTPDEHPASSPGLACVLDPCDSLPVGHTFKSPSGSAQQKRKRSCDENFTCIGSKSSNLICVVDPGAGLLKRLGSTQGGESEPSSSRDARSKKSFCPISVQSEKNHCGEQSQIVSKEPEFDFDIDELLSLSPIECRSPYQGIEEFIENCHSFYEEGSSGKLGGEDLESSRVSFTKKEAQQIDGSKQCPDRGYFSKSYHEDLEQYVGNISDDLKNHPLAPLHLTSSSSPIKLETTKVDFEKPRVSAGVRHGDEIQVRSVVVFPQKRKEAYAKKAGKKEDKVGIINPFSRKEREVMFKDTELERRKEMYLQCVSGHITDHDEQNQGVMNELLSLMNTVARQEGRITDRQWQHPSDLTSRNYSSGADKLANKISLQDWQSKNRKYFRRFASIPDKFQRSQVPQTAAL
ncbi:uncharacterized protein LOC131701550 isoform X2 [Acipenser ruthenus]|uniref:uncharacterized protein LOC131701550 isoform X2 n=1 Tax=Acipenser ruthenus TaxID=7906 RepID=UPI0027426945|nr:uncharacterized protein LOC131701550 isoform X2 [Acipenser ruthenus]